LNPGELKQIKFVVSPSQLSFIGRDNKRVIEPGDFEIYIENLKSQFKLVSREKI
jgi:beta-glucosidase